MIVSCGAGSLPAAAGVLLSFSPLTRALDYNLPVHHGGTEVPCALCGARDTRRIYVKFEWPIARCRRCGLVYATPRAPEASILGRYSREYFYNEYLPAAAVMDGNVDLPFFDERHASMLRLIRRRAPGGRRLLEVGSGAGLFLAAAVRAGWEATGVELSDAAAGFARERLGLDIRQERAESMAVEPGSYDVAVMFDTIEHLFDVRGVLASVKRALRPGGLLVVSTPNYASISRDVLGAGWAILAPLEHTYYFTESTLARLLASCGFAAVAFDRRFEAWGGNETMNYECTHDPAGWRARLYRWVLRSHRDRLIGVVQRLGKSDALLCTARA